MQETPVQFLGQKVPLEKGMATHSSILAWRIPWIEEPGRLQSMGLQRVGHDWVTNIFTFFQSTTGFSSSCVYMWELGHKKGWASQNWYFQTVVLEKTLESPLDSKEIKPVNPKGNHPWIFIGRADSEAEAPILWPPDVKSWFTGKYPDAGKDWGQEEKGVTEDKMVGWYHWLNGHEFELTQGDSEIQGSLACCSSWGHRKLDSTWQLNNNKSQGTVVVVHGLSYSATCRIFLDQGLNPCLLHRQVNSLPPSH